ncbi:MAG: hypothetical protein EOP56_08595 [Sphingobacteriales bacterium]|nr:MAG: hypothetical protein EOP56_08595 [Sphingobacteriales bacterium]
MSFAQDYRISIDGFVMPELNAPVTVFAEAKSGSGYKEIPTRRYQLRCVDGRPAGSGKNGYSFMIDREQVYRNNGRARFELTTDGKTVSVSLSIPILGDMRFNLYTDSIKPILNYYVNVEGTFTNGQILPVDTSLITVTSDNGMMKGMEWIAPKQRSFDKVKFTATSKYNPSLSMSATMYIKKFDDPRDAPGYEDRTEDDIKDGRRRR